METESVHKSTPLLPTLNQLNTVHIFTPHFFQVNWLSNTTERVLEKPSVALLLKNFPTFYGTRRFITVFTRALHWFLSRINPVHTITSYFTNIHINIIFPPTSNLPSGLFPFGFPTKYYTHSASLPCVLHVLSISSSLKDHSNYIWRRVLVMKFLIASLLGQNILLSTLFSNIFNTDSFFSVIKNSP
jgi:hypothetical protein